MKKFIIGFILVAVGVAIGIALNKYYNIPLDNKINIIDLATLLTTIFLAIYIPIFLDKHMQSRRYEKDVVIRKIEGLQSSIKSVNRIVTECVQKNAVSVSNSHLIINEFTSISNELETIITLIGHCHDDKFKAEIECIKSLRFQYRSIVTGGKFQDRNFKFSALTIKEQELIYSKFDKELCLLIFKVNRI